MSSLGLDKMQDLSSAKQVTIVGAGFTGLTLGYFFVKQGWNVKIVEKSERVGGLINTRRSAFGLAETAANGVFNSQLFQDISREIGVELMATKPEAKKRFLFRDSPQRWPFSWRESLRLVFLVFKFVFSKSSLRPATQDSVHAWGARHLGDVLSRFSIETFLQGVYAGDPEKMSAEMILQKAFQPKKKVNWKGYRKGTLTPREGMGEFVDRLSQWLLARGVEIELSKSFVLSSSSRHESEGASDSANENDHADASGRESARESESHNASGVIVLATPGHVAREILQTSGDANLQARAQLLDAVQPLSLVTVTVFWPQHQSRHSGFGCLFPPGYSRPILGILMNSLIFENRSKDCTSETYILGGARHAEVVGWSDTEILNLVVEVKNDFEKFVGEERLVPLSVEITRWPQAFPHYTVELNTALKALEREGQGVYLAGNYLGKIGLAQMLQDNFELASRLCRVPPPSEQDGDEPSVAKLTAVERKARFSGASERGAK